MPPYQIHFDGQDYPWAVPLSTGAAPPASTWTLDTATSFDNTSYGSTGFTVSHTVAVTGNLLVVTMQVWRDTGAATTVTADWNGTPMDFQQGTNNNNMYTYIFSLVNPDTGTHNVTFVITGSNISHKGSVSSWIVAGTPEVDDSNNSVGTTGPVSTSVTTTVDDTLIIDSASQFSANPLTVDASQTTLHNTLSSGVTGASSYELAPTAGSVTMSWTKSGSDDWATAAVAFRIASGGGGPTSLNLLTLLGVG